MAEQNQPTGPKRRSARGRAQPPAQVDEAAPPPPAAPADTKTPPLRRLISLPTVEAASNTLRSLLINFSFFVAFFLLLPALATQLWKNQVVIEPISNSVSPSGARL